MLSLGNAGLLALAGCLLAGCASVKVRNADAAPGGAITTVDPVKSAALGWIPQVGPANNPAIHHWTRMRVIAPAGATQCRTLTPFTSDGPEDEGQPDLNGVLMLAAREGARSIQIACKTPSGVVQRTVTASIYTVEHSPEVRARYSNARPHNFYVLPPLVHVDPRDPDAEARWAAIAAELCPEISERVFGFVCKPGMLETFKAADLNQAP